MDFLNECKYSFRKGLDATDAVLKFMFESYNSVHEKSNLVAVFLDLLKAFDTVRVNILLSKFDHIGKKCSNKQWFLSYLSARTQYLTVHTKELSKGMS